MKKYGMITVLFIALTSLSAHAGDIGMNCFKEINGDEEFIAGGLMGGGMNGKSYISFEGEINDQPVQYTITVNKGMYRYIKSLGNNGGFKEVINIQGKGVFKEAKIVDGYYCRIQD